MCQLSDRFYRDLFHLFVPGYIKSISLITINKVKVKVGQGYIHSNTITFLHIIWGIGFRER